MTRTQARRCSAISANDGSNPAWSTRLRSSGTRRHTDFTSAQPSGHRQVRAIKPSHIQARIGQLSERFEPSTVIASFLVLPGILDLAVADDDIKKNPAKSPVAQVPAHQASKVQIWADSVIACLIDAHPDSLRVLPELAASCGMREDELFGIALEDFDFGEKIVRVRRQVKRLGNIYVFALPKNDSERIVPLSDWDIQAARRHMEKYPPRPYTLPWEKPGGKPHGSG